MRRLKCYTLGLIKPVFAKITHNTQKRKVRSDYVLLAKEKRLGNCKGYQAVIVEEARAEIYGEKLKNLPLIVVSDGLDELNEHDVVQIIPNANELLILYEYQSPHNGLFLTKRFYVSFLMFCTPKTTLSRDVAVVL